MGNPLLSLIVPTRERANTLKYTLASALDQSSTNFEVVVSDNVSEDDTRAVVSAIDDSRLKYFNTGQRLSMCDNYEYALQQARGTYVTIIGDDDAVIPGALDFLLSQLERAPQQQIHMWPLHTYDWPVDGRPAKLAYLAPVQPPKELDLKAKAQRVFQLGAWKYYELPSPYHSAIPRKFLDAIRMRTGRVFHSTQPDVFTAMALPAYADSALNLGRTVTLNGRSARSNGLGFVEKSAMPNIDRFIREYGDYRFHPSLFDDVSAPAKMIPDAVLIACDLFPEIYSAVDFGYSAMWAYVARLRFASHAEIIRKSTEIAGAHQFSMSEFLGYSAVHEASVVRRNMLNRASQLGRHNTPIPDNIHDFVRLLAKGGDLI